MPADLSGFVSDIDRVASVLELTPVANREIAYQEIAETSESQLALTITQRYHASARLQECHAWPVVASPIQSICSKLNPRPTGVFL